MSVSAFGRRSTKHQERSAVRRFTGTTDGERRIDLAKITRIRVLSVEDYHGNQEGLPIQAGLRGFLLGESLAEALESLSMTQADLANRLSPGKALIQLSLRYKTNDHLWFSLFHEAGHVLLHAPSKLIGSLGAIC